MNFYPKIDSLFNRDDNFKVNFEYRRPEFGYVDNWLWMEKIDGANISIINTEAGTEWRGRTPKANFIDAAVEHLDEVSDSLHEHLSASRADHGLESIEIFGELYGPKIQSGGIYRTDLGTTFYDMRVNRKVWLPHEAVLAHCDMMDLDMPVFGYGHTDDLIDFVAAGFDTFETRGSGGPAEGIIAKTEVPLYNNAGNRLIWKLKHRDFK